MSTSQGQPTAIVVGAGPAGCAATWALTQAHIPTVVLERGTPGKDKACGDALTDGAVAALQNYGLTAEVFQELGAQPYGYVKFAVPEGPLGLIDHGSAGWMLRRAALDQWLRDQLPIDVEYGTTVTHVVRSEGNGFAVTMRAADGTPRQLQADVVILATGAANHLSQAWGVDGRPIMGASLSAYVEGTPPAGLEFSLTPDYQPGYAWNFPLDATRMNVGICGMGTSMATLHPRARRWAAQWAESVTWRGGGQPFWSGRGTVWHDPLGLISCGDAAGLVDPWNGEGITLALLSGAAAGNAMASFLTQGGDPAPLADYSTWVAQIASQRFTRTPEQYSRMRHWLGLS